MNQATEQWKDFAPEFYRDGSLRDIYVFNTRLNDWISAARFIVDQGYRISFSGAWTESVFPPNIGTLFPSGLESELTLMAINVSSVWINCHFFSPDEIEFDPDPAEITESVAEIVWTPDGLKAALLINDYAHAIFDFANRRSYCRTGFPSPAPDWNRGAWAEELIDLFRRRETGGPTKRCNRRAARIGFGLLRVSSRAARRLQH